jgi:hypothetical protein
MESKSQLKRKAAQSGMSMQTMFASSLNKAFMDEEMKSCWAFSLEDEKVMVEVSSQMGNPMFDMIFWSNADPIAALKVIKAAVGAL